MTATLVVFIFYGGKMSALPLRVPDTSACERVADQIKTKLFSSSVTVGRIEHICVTGAAPTTGGTKE